MLDAKNIRLWRSLLMELDELVEGSDAIRVAVHTLSVVLEEPVNR